MITNSVDFDKIAAFTQFFGKGGKGIKTSSDKVVVFFTENRSI